MKKIISCSPSYKNRGFSILVTWDIFDKHISEEEFFELEKCVNQMLKYFKKDENILWSNWLAPVCAKAIIADFFGRKIKKNPFLYLIKRGNVKDIVLKFWRSRLKKS